MSDRVDASTDGVLDLLVEVLEGAGVVADRVGERSVMTMLAGEFKRTIPVLFELGDRTLAVTSLFATVLDEGHREVFELLLHRNERARHVHFALDDAGHLVLVGRVPVRAIDMAHLDEVLGEIVGMADSAFNSVLRAGFAKYLEHEQAWRAAVGLPPNPVGNPPNDAERPN